LERLSAKEYAVFIYEVDRGDKGLWYKVLIGPFADQETAAAMAERVKTEEQLTAIVKKR
jgi:DedD protein